MHSDALHTTERLRWKSPTAISYTITIDDPKIFTKPWSQEFEIIAKPEWEKDGLFEYVCQQANYAHELMVGEADSVNRATTIVP